MPVSSSTEHWIKQDALTINLNHFGDPDYLQVSVLAGAVVMAFKQDVIGYNAAHNYRTWPIEAANTYLETTSAVNVYAKLTRSEVNARALIAYDAVLRDIEGREITYAEDGSEILGDPNPELYYVFLGQISASVNSNGESVLREWTIDFKTGNLDTNQYQNEEAGGEWTKMFRLNKVTDMIDVLKTFSSAIFKRLVIGDKEITNVQRSEIWNEDLKLDNETIPTTKFTEDRYLSKVKDDRSAGAIASDKGFEAGQFVTGATGAACYQDKDGNWHIETDHLKVRKKAEFTEVDIQTTYHVGGQQISTGASMVVDYIFETQNAYRCYFLKKDANGREVRNQWQPKDQAYCNTFNLVKQENGTLGNHYLWRFVTATSNETKDNAEERVFGDVTIRTSDYHFVDLSKSVCADNSDAPYPSDEIVLLGHQGNDSSRQGCIIVAGAGKDSPYIYEFTGVGTIPFYLPDPETRLKPGDNMFTGVMRIQGGSTGIANLKDFPEEVAKAVQIGSVNLLRNSGFTGDYKSEETEDMSVLGDGSELFSKSLKYWEGSAEINDEDFAVSGKSAFVGSLSQKVRLMKGENYVVSFKAKGSSVKVLLGSEFSDIALTDTYESYNVNFVSDGTGLFSIVGKATIYDLQLERGTIATDWHASPYDNDRTLAEFQALKYIQDAIQEGDTTILGGLILSSMIQLGNYKDGVMKKVNAGMSGIYNDDNDVAFWGGGTFEQAISTVMKFKQNPNFRPTDEEWRAMANFVESHGGDLFLHGNIYAENGYFRGRLEQGNEATVLEKDGSGHLANKNIRWTKEGVIYRRAPENIEWRPITDFEETRLITYESGLYFDLNVYYDFDAYTLSVPEYEKFVIAITLPYASRSNMAAVLGGNFRVYDGEKHVNVNYLTIDHLAENTGKVFLLEYYQGEWSVRGERCVVVGEKIGDTTRTVAYLGRQGNIYIGEDAESRTAIDGEKVKTQKLEINDESEDAIKVKGGIKIEKTVLAEISVKSPLYQSGDKDGKTVNISIPDKLGTHQIEVTGGISTGYSYEKRAIGANEVVDILVVTELPANPNPNTLYVVL